MADVVVIGLRALVFVAVLQAAGVPVFLSLFGDQLSSAAPAIRSLGRRTALVGLLLAVAYQLAAPARLTGDLSGALDGSLQALLLASDAGAATGIRVLGLAIVGAGSFGSSRAAATARLVGSVLIVVSFAFMGHTASDDRRWLLAGLLILHLSFVAFWFGAFWPLELMSRHEPLATSGVIVQQFSDIAIWLVPGIFLAGLTISALLLPSLASLFTPYGWLLLGKMLGFALLMVPAALNKWVLGPRMANGAARAVKVFRRSIQTEWLLVATVLTVTAVMTGLYSPSH